MDLNGFGVVKPEPSGILAGDAENTSVSVYDDAPEQPQSHLMNVSNFNDICRTCLSRDDLKSLFDDADVGPSVTIQQMLKVCLSIRILKKDTSLPQNICSNCISELSRCYKFRERCQAVQDTLAEAHKVAERVRKRGDAPQLMVVSAVHVDVESNQNEEIPDDQAYLCDDDDDDDDDNYTGNEYDNDNDYQPDSNDDDENDNDAVSEVDKFDEFKEDDSDPDDDMPLIFRFQQVKSPITRRKKGKTRAKRKGKKESTTRQQGPDENLEEHPWKCLECDLVFNTRKEVKAHHRAKKHDKRLKYECQTCHKVFRTYMLYPHLKRHANECQFMCKICGKTYTWRKNLQRHMAGHVNKRPYVCDRCGKGFTRLANRKLHSCESRYNSMGRPKGNPFIKCDICERKFTSLRWFKRHMMCYHSNSAGVAEKLYPPAASLPERLLTQSLDITDQPPVNLDGTPMVVDGSTAVAMEAAKEAEAPKKEPKPPKDEEKYACSICGKTYKSKCYLKLHMARHGEKTFLCSECGKSFNSTVLLRSHLKTHTGERPYPCTFCPKRFAQTGSLQAHLNTHTGERPYKCELCPKTFKQRCHVTLHMRTHTGEKPYECTYCGKAFNVKCTLTVHMRTHTGETPYKCPECGKGFYDSSSMKKHHRSHSAGGAGAGGGGTSRPKTKKVDKSGRTSGSDNVVATAAPPPPLPPLHPQPDAVLDYSDTGYQQQQAPIMRDPSLDVYPQHQQQPPMDIKPPIVNMEHMQQHNSQLVRSDMKFSIAQR